MTSQYRLTSDYTLTIEELHYLQTTQRLATEKMERTYKKDRVFTEDEEDVWDDLHAFGSEIREAIESSQQVIPLKLGVIWWLIGIWNTLQLHKSLPFIPGETQFTSVDIARMYSLFFEDYSKSR